MKRFSSSGYLTSEKFREKIAARFDENGKPKKSKKQKRPFKIVAANLFFIIAVFIVYLTLTGNNEIYKTAVLQTEECNFRFSIATKKDSTDYIITLTAESNLERETTLSFSENIANIDFIYNEINVLSIPIGDNITELRLAPLDVRTFAALVDIKKLNNHIIKKGNYKPGRRKSLIDFEGTSVMVNAKLTLNTPEKNSQTIDFRTGNLK